MSAVPAVLIYVDVSNINSGVNRKEGEVLDPVRFVEFVADGRQGSRLSHLELLLACTSLT